MISEGDCSVTVHLRHAIIEQIGTINMMDALAIHPFYAQRTKSLHSFKDGYRAFRPT